MRVDSRTTDRACGAVLGSAIGDALGAGYEFGSARLGPDGPAMIGGGLGGFAPGEWTDDTTMAWAVLDVAARRGELLSDEALDEIAGHFRDWYETGPADIGNQTATVLRAVGPRPQGSAMAAVAADLHARTGHTGGNGSLMRTAAVALPHLDDPEAVVAAASRISALTHVDPHAVSGCVLWSLAIRHAVLHAELDLRAGLAHLDPAEADYWSDRIDEAEQSEPGRFNPNGWVVAALQAAWSAIVHTPVPEVDPCRHLQDALHAAIAIGHDTDTVAAIAGALLGARWGASAVPAAWRRVLHGYPGLRGEDLVGLAHLAAAGGPTHHGWPTIDRIDYSGYGPVVTVAHPHDDRVLLGNAQALDDLPAGVTAVVSLCLVGRSQVPDGVEHVGFRLIDDARSNAHLDFVLADAARTVADLRAEGHTVLVHCVAGQSRTPTVGTAYSLRLGVPLAQARAEVFGAMPSVTGNSAFPGALERLAAR